MSHDSRLIMYCCSANFISSAGQVMFPLAILPMSKHFEWSMYYQGWLLSSLSIGLIFSQLLCNKIIKRFGSKWTLSSAVLVWSVLFMSLPWLSHHQARRSDKSTMPLIAVRIGIGFVEGVVLPTIYHIYSHGLPTDVRATAFGYLTASASIGQTMAAIMTPHFAWDVIFIMMGVTGLLWTLLWLYTSRATPIYEPMVATVALDYVARSPQETSPGLPFHLLQTKSKKSITRFFNNWSLWSIYLAHFSMNCTSYVVVVWLPTYLHMSLGANNTHLSFTALPYLANSICSIVVGHMTDMLISKKRWSLLLVRRVMTFLGLFLPGMLMLIFMAVSSIHLAIILIALSMGLLACNSSGHIGNHVDVAPTEPAVTFAISNTMATIPGLLAGPLTAHLVVSSRGHWFPVFVLTAAINCFGSVVYILKSSTKPMQL